MDAVSQLPAPVPGCSRHLICHLTYPVLFFRNGNFCYGIALAVSVMVFTAVFIIFTGYMSGGCSVQVSETVIFAAPDKNSFAASKTSAS